MLIVFSKTHCVGHQRRHLHDREHPRHYASVAKAVGDPIKDVYGGVDAAVGRLLEQVSPGAATVVPASYGMGPHYDATFLVDSMRQALAGKNTRSRTASAVGLVRRSLRRLPSVLRQWSGPLGRPVARRFEEMASLLVARLAFAVPNNEVDGVIRINRVGREPRGLITAADFDAFCTGLSDELLSFVNVETGEEVVRRVMPICTKGHMSIVCAISWSSGTGMLRSRLALQKPARSAAAKKKCCTEDHKAEGLFFITAPASRLVSDGRILHRRLPPCSGCHCLRARAHPFFRAPTVRL
jgi:hypothetical protein